MNKLTIGQVAAFAGVTVKTVRHYHRLGLIKEPKRDSAGYRRYGSSDLLRLVQVRTLAAAGVPLAEVAPLLEASPERFSAAVSDIQRRINERIEQLIARSDTLHQLTAGDRLLLPERACLILDKLTALGFGADYVAAQREGLVLFRALLPDALPHFLGVLAERLEDDQYVDLMKRCWDALSWAPDDPRLDRLATTLADNMLARRDLLELPAGFELHSDTVARYGLINHHREDKSPTMAKLTSLLEAKLRAAGIDPP